MFRIDRRLLLLCTGLVLLLLVAYANHFQNEFHFDDLHTITTNDFVKSLGNIPLFFTNAQTFSTMRNTSWRPVTSVSLAIDYWLGHGYKPFVFHLSTFLWFFVQLVLMVFLFRRIMDAAAPHPSNIWTAVLATACYGLHPANAETINYIIQRGDVYNTLGTVATLLWFAARPEQRKRGWYLIPALVASFAKAPALIFPLILLAYVWLFEEGSLGSRLRATLPAFVAAAVAAIITARMTPPVFQGGAASPDLYRLTQPWVALHYFKSFFLPTELSADTDWTYLQPFSLQAIAGYLFVIGLVAAAFYTARRRETRPIAFGIVWFFLALAPTSLMPLSEVTNDHRMFFPFVGLTLAIFWSLRLATQARIRLRTDKLPVLLWAALIIVVLAAEAAGTRQRNLVWRTEDSLWLDVARKSPQNPRGLMNCGASLVASGKYAEALPYLERAKDLQPANVSMYINLGMAYGGVGRDAEAAQHFEKASALAPREAGPHFYYALWLRSKHRMAEAQTQLEAALQFDRLIVPARHWLMQMYDEQKNLAALDRMVDDTLQLVANDEMARGFLAARASRLSPAPSPAAPTPAAPAPAAGAPAAGAPAAGAPAAGAPADAETILHESVASCRAGKYEECIAGAQKAIALKPDFAEAYNNLAAAYIALRRWDEGIRAAAQAVRLKPDFELAKKNLERARALKQRGGG